MQRIRRSLTHHILTPVVSEVTPSLLLELKTDLITTDLVSVQKAESSQTKYGEALQQRDELSKLPGQRVQQAEQVHPAQVE
jgi:hypothetical protein